MASSTAPRVRRRQLQPGDPLPFLFYQMDYRDPQSGAAVRLLYQSKRDAEIARDNVLRKQAAQ